VDERNSVVLSGRIVELEPLRHTPAGIPVASGRLRHESQQGEAGGVRKVELEVDWLAAGDAARLIAKAPLGMRMEAEGFLAPRTRKHRQPVLHIVRFNLLEEGNGI
jgi:primosomal replication protein N